MRSMKKQLTFITVLMVIIIAALTLGGLQLFGSGKVKPSEWFKKAETKVEQTVPNATDKDKTPADNGGEQILPDTADKDKTPAENGKDGKTDEDKQTSVENEETQNIPESDEESDRESDSEQTASVMLSAMRSVMLASNDGIAAQAETKTYATAEEARNSFLNEGARLDEFKGMSYSFPLQCDGDELGTIPYLLFTWWRDSNASSVTPYAMVYSIDLNEYLAMGYSNFKVITVSGISYDGNVMGRIMSEDGYLTCYSLYINSLFSDLARLGVECDEPQTVELPADPVKEGYTFAGWYYGTEATHNENCTAYKNEPIYTTTNLHAHWTINQYTVSFDMAGGVVAGEYLKDETVDWGTVLTLHTPARIGYDFLGWYFSDGTKYENQPIKTDTHLTAKWQIQIFTVTFYVDGEEYKAIKVQYGTALSKAMQTANVEAYQVTNIDGARLSKQNSVITEDTEVLVTELTGFEKYGDFVGRNPWYTWFTVGVLGVLLIISIVGIVNFVHKR